MNNLLNRIPSRYWAYFAFVLWGAICFALLHKTSYGLDEGAAHALLLVWSVADNVVSPILTLGFPDLRTVFLTPAGILWTGNVLAAKVTTILAMSIAGWALHAWRSREGDTEGALLATGLLLLSPLLLDQIDAISVSPYLLLVFALGAWANQNYRESKRAFGGMYFAQIFLCLASVSFHPAGLAYPLALLWTWYKKPIDQSHRNYIFSGIISATLIALILTSGWNHVEWLSNPVRSLSSILLGPSNGDDFGTFHWLCGIGALIILILVIWKQAKNLLTDFLGLALLLALMIGVFIGDNFFALAALATCLYWGIPLLLHRSASAHDGFWKQRGIVLSLIFLIATTFMVADRTHFEMQQAGNLSPRDSLIKVMAEDSGLFFSDENSQNASEKKTIRIASQWPALTMLACRCDALPLPPNAKNSDALFAMLHGIDYLIFDPHDPMNDSLSHNLANMDAGKVETVTLQLGGVIVAVKKPAPPTPPATKHD
jgi:hypothetical protein